MAALAWMTERILQKTNPLTMLVEKIAAYAPWIIVALACASILSYTIEQQKRRKV
jgi:ferric-dicitrate binding protein FerR (iron transport regulator)